MAWEATAGPSQGEAPPVTPGSLALLLAAGRAMVSGTAPGAREQPPADFDWTDALAFARRHRMVQIVGRWLDALPAGAVPPTARDAWRAARFEGAQASLAAARELARVVSTLRAAGVEPVAYKGPALALVAYGDAGARPCADLDLVVPPAEYATARAALLRAGFASRRGLTASQEAVILGGQGHADFARADSDAPFVELHWRFAARRVPWTLPVTAVRARADTLAVAGVEVRSPCVDDQLLLLAWHGTRHGWEQFEWLVAFAALLEREHAGAGTLLDRAAPAGGRRALLVGATLASRCLGLPASAPLARIGERDRRVTALVDAAMSRWMTRATWSTAAEHDYERDALERPRDRARRLLATLVLPTPREWEALRLPASLSALYVPLRLVRLAWRTITRAGSDA